MTATYQLSIPDQAEATLTVKATVGEFRKALKHLDTLELSVFEGLYDLRRGIREVLEHADKHFWAQHEGEAQP